MDWLSLSKNGNCLGTVSKCFLHVKSSDNRQKSDLTQKFNLHFACRVCKIWDFNIHGPNEYNMLCGLETLSFFKGRI